MKLYCISAAVLTALLMSLSVFLGNLSHSEYKSQMRKRKAKKTVQVVKDTPLVNDDV